MLTSQQCYKEFGAPESESGMVVWDVPKHLRLGAIPGRVYCNRKMVGPLSTALSNLVDRGLTSELKTWDGCFNIRKKKRSTTLSLHSWGLAVDVNAAWNGFGKTPMLSAAFVKCFTDAGFDWGGLWNTPDGMHFQIKEL